jgi:hypothetical protein
MAGFVFLRQFFEARAALIENDAAELASAARGAEFVRNRPISRVLG